MLWCVGDKEPCGCALPALGGLQHRHRLCCGRRLIQQGRIGQRQTGEVDDDGLEVEQSLQTPLGDFGLIGSVLCVPGGILEDISLDDGRCQTVVITHPQKGTCCCVAAADLAQSGQQSMLVPGGFHLQPVLTENGRRSCSCCQGLKILVAKLLKHFVALMFTGTNVSTFKIYTHDTVLLRRRRLTRDGTKGRLQKLAGSCRLRTWIAAPRFGSMRAVSTNARAMPACRLGE